MMSLPVRSSAELRGFPLELFKDHKVMKPLPKNKHFRDTIDKNLKVSNVGFNHIVDNVIYGNVDRI